MGSGTGSGSHGQLFRPYWGSSAWHSRWVNEREKAPCIKDPDDELMSPDDMAVRIREVLARPWIGVCVPLALSLSSSKNKSISRIKKKRSLWFIRNKAGKYKSHKRTFKNRLSLFNSFKVVKPRHNMQ